MEKNSTPTPARLSLLKRLRRWLAAAAIAPIIGKTTKQAYAIIEELEREQHK